MRRLARIFETTVEIVSGHGMAWLILVLMAMTLVEAVSRYAIRRPLMIADEIGGYAVVAIIFIGLAYTWKEGRHVSINFVVARIPTQVRKWLRLITVLIVIVTTSLIIKGSYEFVMVSHEIGRKSETSLRLPLEWPQAVLIIGGVLLLFQLIVEFVRTVGALKTGIGTDNEH